MPAQKLIAVKTFCSYHNISPDLVHELHRNEVLSLVMVKRTSYISEKSLPDFEKAIRLYNDLHINIEGIQTILHLLHSLERKEAELTTLRNTLEFYKQDLPG